VHGCTQFETPKQREQSAVLVALVVLFLLPLTYWLAWLLDWAICAVLGPSARGRIEPQEKRKEPGREQRARGLPSEEEVVWARVADTRSSNLGDV
jgi:CBS domain containing-hemolysin-like protein